MISHTRATRAALGAKARARPTAAVAKAPTTKDVKALPFAFFGKTLFNGYTKA